MPDGGFRPGAGSRVLTGPNVITFARICAVPVAIWLVLRGHMHWALGLFILAGLSDAVDGWLARRGAASALGAVLDPIADKALLVSMFVTLAWMDVLPALLVILLVFRDVVIVGGVIVLAVLGQPPRIRPLMIAKVNTALQIVLVALALLLAGLPHAEPTALLGLVVFGWVVCATTLLSGGATIWRVARPRDTHLP